jgi:head-tail adaptor
MAKRPSAGDMIHRVAFDVRAAGNPDSPEDYGVTVMDWVEQFTCRAAFIHLRGGESVLASRLEGRHSQVIQVRASSETRAITTEWRARDVNNGAWSGADWAGPIYQVKDITPHEEDRAFLDILVQTGTRG